MAITTGESLSSCVAYLPIASTSAGWVLSLLKEGKIQQNLSGVSLCTLDMYSARLTLSIPLWMSSPARATLDRYSEVSALLISEPKASKQQYLHFFHFGEVLSMAKCNPKGEDRNAGGDLSGFPLFLSLPHSRRTCGCSSSPTNRVLHTRMPGNSQAADSPRVFFAILRPTGQRANTLVAVFVHLPHTHGRQGGTWNCSEVSVASSVDPKFADKNTIIFQRH